MADLEVEGREMPSWYIVKVHTDQSIPFIQLRMPQSSSMIPYALLKELVPLLHVKSNTFMNVS